MKVILNARTLLYIVGFLVGFFIAQMANAQTYQYYNQPTFYDQITGDTTISLTIDCPNRDMEFDQFWYFGRLTGTSGSPNVSLAYPGGTTTQAVPTTGSALKQTFTLNPTVTCLMGETKNFVLTRTAGTFLYYRVNPTNGFQVQVVPNGDTRITTSASYGTTNVLPAMGLREVIPEVESVTLEVDLEPIEASLAEIVGLNAFFYFVIVTVVVILFIFALFYFFSNIKRYDY